ncbi:MAG: hypothetical protein ACTHLE_21960 [Agriterribacter sp.]
MENRVVEFCALLECKAFAEASCFPVDRYFLEPYMEDILAIDRDDFILCNLERKSNTYTIQLLLCLPELWEDVSTDDIIDWVKQFTNIFSYYTLIEFTYKYVEINIIDLILSNKEIDISNNIKLDIIDYLKNSQYPNLVKCESDYFFFEENLYGIGLDAWAYIKQKLLLDNRIKSAFKNIQDVYVYIMSLDKK